jgi:cell division protease FtsH
MSEKLGPLAYGKNEEEIFLGREVTKHKEYSDETARIIDQEIKKIVTEAMDKAVKLLSDNVDLLHNLSKELLEREILDSHEIDMVMNGEELPPIKRNGNGHDFVSNKEKESVPDEVPDHVKKMLDEKMKRSEENKTETKNPEISEEAKEDKDNSEKDDSN